MSEKIRREVEEALDDDDLNRAVDRLKYGIRKDPYWEWGHRTLGDVYLVGLEHSSYALVQYRKLREVKEDLQPEEQLKLAWAYDERDFPDKVARILDEIEPDELPDEMTVINEKFEAKKLFDRMDKQTERNLEEQSDDFFRKYAREGDGHRDHGNFFDAQQAYQKALEYSNDPEVRIKLARCLIQRSKYPEAIEHLKELQNISSVQNEADDLLNKVYERLGLNQLFDESNDDDHDEPGSARKVS